jgi:hypothetical protein
VDSPGVAGSPGFDAAEARAHAARVVERQVIGRPGYGARLVVPVVPVDSQYCGGGGASRTADTRSGRACVIGP